MQSLCSGTKANEKRKERNENDVYIAVFSSSPPTYPIIINIDIYRFILGDNSIAWDDNGNRRTATSICHIYCDFVGALEP